MRRLLALLLLLAACAGQDRVAQDLPEEIRDQLHAATGHDEGECEDLRAREAIIAISENGFEPECSIVTKAQAVTVHNLQSIDDTWIVADPETEAEIARHVRLILEVAAGGVGMVEPIGEYAPTGVWPCYGRESRHQCRIVVVP